VGTQNSCRSVATIAAAGDEMQVANLDSAGSSASSRRSPITLGSDSATDLLWPGVNMRKTLLAVLICFFAVPISWSQRVELTGFAGLQTNGGLDLSNSLFRRIDVQNGKNYGLAAGFLVGDRYGVEFMWAYNKADTLAQPRGTGSDINVFTLDSNQYFGNIFYHFAGREKKLRPFLMVGAGATNLSAARQNVGSSTRAAFDLGGGVKYNFSKLFGLRLQAKWSPAYLATTNAGYWCDPFWGGCWTVGENHYLHELDAAAGITLRF
jgi:opacity protein-like surface antigen